MGLYYTVAVNIARVFFNACRVKVEGKEGVPPRGPLIVVCNHLSNGDPSIVAACMPRRVHFLAKQGLFKNFIARNVLTGIGVHPLNREGLDLDALRWNLDLLSRDKVIALFPEGTRSRGEGMIRGKAGVAYLALRSGAPILPVAITRTENLQSYWKVAFAPYRVKVTMGQPFSLPVIEGKLSRPVLQDLTDMVMYRIAMLLPPEYRGYYAAAESGTAGALGPEATKTKSHSGRPDPQESRVAGSGSAQERS